MNFRENPLAWLLLGFGAGYVAVNMAPQKPCKPLPPAPPPTGETSGIAAFGALLRVCDTVDNASGLLEPMARGYVPSPYDLVKLTKTI